MGRRYYSFNILDHIDSQYHAGIVAGTETTDTSASVLAALKAAQNGEKCYVPPGTYPVTTIEDGNYEFENLHIGGEGTFKRLEAGYDSDLDVVFKMFDIKFKTCSYCRVYDLTFDGGDPLVEGWVIDKLGYYAYLVSEVAVTETELLTTDALGFVYSENESDAEVRVSLLPKYGLIEDIDNIGVALDRFSLTKLAAGKIRYRRTSSGYIPLAPSNDPDRYQFSHLLKLVAKKGETVDSLDVDGINIKNVSGPGLGINGAFDESDYGVWGNIEIKNVSSSGRKATRSDIEITSNFELARIQNCTVDAIETENDNPQDHAQELHITNCIARQKLDLNSQDLNFPKTYITNVTAGFLEARGNTAPFINLRYLDLTARNVNLTSSVPVDILGIFDIQDSEMRSLDFTGSGYILESGQVYNNAFGGAQAALFKNVTFTHTAGAQPDYWHYNNNSAPDTVTGVVFESCTFTGDETRTAFIANGKFNYKNNTIAFSGKSDGLPQSCIITGDTRHFHDVGGWRTEHAFSGNTHSADYFYATPTQFPSTDVEGVIREAHTLYVDADDLNDVNIRQASFVGTKIIFE